MTDFVVDPGGSGDYSTLAAYVAAEATDLVSATDIHNVECICTNGNADTASCAITGYITSSSYYINIYVGSGYRHNGTYQTGNVYRRERSGTVLSVREDHVRLTGIEFSLTISWSGENAVSLHTDIADGADIRISHCIIKATLSGSADGNWGIGTVYEDTGTRYVRIWNNIIYDFVNGTATSPRGVSCFNGYTLYCYNNTVYNCYWGYHRQSGTFVAKNCVAQDCHASGACFTGTFSGDSEYNCSDDGTHPGGNGQTGEVAFADEGADDFHLDSTDIYARGNGTDLSTDPDGWLSFSDDIDGDTRSAWDIGADEYAAAGGGLEIPIAMHHYKQMGGV